MVISDYASRSLLCVILLQDGANDGAPQLPIFVGLRKFPTEGSDGE